MQRIEAFAHGGNEALDAVTLQEIRRDQEGAPFRLGFEEEIRQVVGHASPDMDDDMGAAIEKQARHLQPDAATGAGDDHILPVEQFWMKHVVFSSLLPTVHGIEARGNHAAGRLRYFRFGLS